MDIEIKVYRGYSQELVDLIHSFEKQVFEQPYSKDKIKRECSAKHQLLALFAFVDGNPAGFKVGYEMTARLYYSWIGGVIPDFRGNGVARQLMAQQHEMIKEMGYKVVRTHTENRFRNMLILNLRSGFDIVGVTNEITKNKTIIVLDKVLNHT